MTAWQPEELREALTAVVSLASKSQAALKSMADKGGRAAQITLLERRVRALRIAQTLLEREMKAPEQPG